MQRVKCVKLGLGLQIAVIVLPRLSRMDDKHIFLYH